MTPPRHNHPAAGDEEYRGFRMSSIWAYTVIDDDDQEGIPAWNGMPLIASDRIRLDDLKQLAQFIADDLGKEVNLRRFEFSEDVLTLKPRGRG